MPRHKLNSSAQGSVLMSVIWILAMLAVFSVAVNRQVSQELIFGVWMRDRVQTRALVKAAVARAIFEIQKDEFLTFDTLNEKWASNPDAFKEIEIGPGTFSVQCNADPQTAENEGEAEGAKQLLYGACDESARININTSGEEVLFRLLRAAAELSEEDARKAAQAIVDWRDGDDAVMPEGAENTYYRSLPDSYEPRNANFQSIPELRMVRGIDPEIFKKLEPFITIYSEGSVNFNTASSTVIQAFGASPELARAIIEFRMGTDLLPGTKDDAVIQDPGSITSALGTGINFATGEFDLISSAVSQNLLTVGSKTFRIHAIGRLNRHGREVLGRGVCVVRRDGTVLMWQEDSE